MGTLQTYLTATQWLLHDANFKYWSQQTMIDAINTAQTRAVGDSSCYRQLQVCYLSQGLEVYTYGSVTGCNVTAGGSGYSHATVCTFSAPPSGVTATGTVSLLAGAISAIIVTNAGSGYLTAPSCTITDTGGGVNAAVTATILNPSTLDMLNTTILWGQDRITLDTYPFTKFQAGVRSWVQWKQQPCARAKYGQSSWYIGPIPDQMYVSEWDSVVLPPTLVNLTDVSVVSSPYDESMPYYAAHVCKFQEQSFAEADRFLQYYTQKMKYAIRATQMRVLPSVYSG